MNFETILTTLSQINPFTCMLLGFVFLFAAPSEIAWGGWLCFAIGSGSLCVKLFHTLGKMWEKQKENNKIKEELDALTDQEEIVLILMICHNKRTMRDDDFENVLQQYKLSASITDILRSLNDKDLIYYNYCGLRGFSVTVPNNVWAILKKRYKKFFNTAHKKEAGK